MNPKNRQALSWLLITTIVLVMIGLTASILPSALQADAANQKIIKGTVTNTTIVETPDGLRVHILTLSDGNMYRLSSGHEQGIGKGFDVELIVPLNFKPDKDDVSHVYPNAIPVIAAKVTAIPIPGTNDKLAHPPTNPPKVIKKTQEGQNTPRSKQAKKGQVLH